MRAALMIAMLTVAVPDRPDRTPKEVKPAPTGIQGHWQGVNATVFGQPQKPMPGEEDIVIHITAGEILTFKKGMPENQKLTYTIDTTKTPAAIDLVQKQGRMDFKLAGIFKIEGDKLTLCLSFLDAARPTEFVSTAASQTILLEMKRVPK